MAFGDYSVTRGTYVIGRSSGGLVVDVEDITGIYSVNVRSHDTEYEARDGSHAGIDVRAAKVIGVSWVIRSETGSVDAVLDDLALAYAAWAPSSTDVTITVVLPGSRSLVYTGRCRGLTEDLAQLPFGAARVNALFVVPSGVATSGSL